MSLEDLMRMDYRALETADMLNEWFELYRHVLDLKYPTLQPAA